MSSWETSNARVGSRSGDKDPWGNVRGPFGLGKVNDAGREFLNFQLLNKAIICNTLFAHTHANVAAPKVQKMVLHRLCSDAAEGQKEVHGCSSYERSRMSH